MGMLIDGRWCENGEQEIRDGSYVRAPSVVQQPIPPATIAGLHTGNKALILVASASCPWSHAVVLLRSIKQLESIFPLQMAVGPRIEGYALQQEGPLPAIDGQKLAHVHQLYTRGNATFTGKSTVPLIWDVRHQIVISNDSSKILQALDDIESPRSNTLIPDHLRLKIDLMNNTIRKGLANAVYRAGLAQTQRAYDDAVSQVFTTLDWLEGHLQKQRLLFGTILTTADLRLFATLVRFDTVYATHFRCTRYRLTDYKNTWAYTRDLYQQPSFSDTVDFDAILAGYYLNDGEQNPFDIVPERPSIDWAQATSRNGLGPMEIWSNQDQAPVSFQG